jgi:small subunit ribosomal protein S20
MPILRNAKKALRHSQRAMIYNSKVKSQVKTALKSMAEKPTAGNLSIVQSKLDLAVKNNIIHRNKAARLKSRLLKLVPSK